MRLSKSGLVLSLSALTAVAAVVPQYQVAQDKSAGTGIAASAQAFVSMLDAEQKKKAVLAYDAADRVKWQFIPLPTRKGLPLMEMKPEQQVAAKKVLQSAVSQLGYEKATTIMSMEDLLFKLEGSKDRDRRNPEKYYFTIYGELGKHWGLSIEGHHLSLNFVLEGDKIVDSTPQFFASNPAELKDNYSEKFTKGMRVLKDEETLAFDLLASLSAEQKKQAMIPGETPAEIKSANVPQPPTLDASGIRAGDLKDAQKDLLKKLLNTYASKMRAEVAKSRWELIEKAGFDKVTFGWSGADKPGVGHYYRIQGPSFLVEFINVQADAAGNPANHIHCVWRDREGDFDLPIGG